MDQVKAFGKLMWEQRFWVLSALGTIIVLFTWMRATGNLESEFNARKSAIEGKFGQMNKLRTVSVHPNDEVLKEEQAQAQRQREYVLEVWRSFYDRQREEVLNWPKHALGEAFVNYIETRKFRDSILPDMRDIYRNYIRDRFDGLAEIVQAYKQPESGIAGRGVGRGGEGGRGGESRGFGGEGRGFGGEGFAAATLPEDAEDQDYLVLWLDQDKVRAQLAFERRPTSTQIWVTQEDLWVYESLLNVIARTNEERGATRPDNTAIKAIVSLDIGRDANAGGANDKGQVMMPRSAAGAGAMSEFGGRGGEMMERGGEGGYGRGMEGEMGRGGEGGYGRGMEGEGASADDGLLAYRYLDDEGNPIPGEVDSFGTEFRQLPVRMVLMMDQRWIPQLLVEASNAPLPLVVQQVRLNPSKATSLTDGGRGGMGGGFRGGRGGAMMPDLSGLTNDPSVAEVEIRGAIYIYNEPDENQLDVPGGDDDGQLAIN